MGQILFQGDFDKKCMSRKFRIFGDPIQGNKKWLRRSMDQGIKGSNEKKCCFGLLYRKNIKNSIHHYNHMVKPILLCASDFWGCLKLPKNNPIEGFTICSANNYLVYKNKPILWAST